MAKDELKQTVPLFFSDTKAIILSLISKSVLPTVQTLTLVTNKEIHCVSFSDHCARETVSLFTLTLSDINQV
ncbi:hypothetical protein T11_8887 [Trichinella zimbabwensis]|uniref:Uncharacterized protein n=1 Tax=Trichinella zimbabwensis TaxID=268475 RepID=A0A0V1I681_9BILA|nr:hypothetical protein T11_8887 [Trichinella zimbabwensis]